MQLLLLLIIVLLTFPNLIQSMALNCTPPNSPIYESGDVGHLKLVDDWKVTIPVYFLEFTDSSNQSQHLKSSEVESLIAQTKVYFPVAHIELIFGNVQTVISATMHNSAYSNPSLVRQYNNMTVNSINGILVFTSKGYLASSTGYAYYPTLPEDIWTNNLIWIQRTRLIPYLLAHEIGHVLNLRHTFQQALDNSVKYDCVEKYDDGVSDTPYETMGFTKYNEDACYNHVSQQVCNTHLSCKWHVASQSCWRDSCPLDTGADPMTNVMSYHTDSNQVSPGQVSRVKSHFSWRVHTYQAWGGKYLDDEDDDIDANSLGFIIGGIVGGLVLACILYRCVNNKKNLYPSANLVTHV